MPIHVGKCPQSLRGILSSWKRVLVTLWEMPEKYWRPHVGKSSNVVEVLWEMPKWKRKPSQCIARCASRCFHWLLEDEKSTRKSWQPIENNQIAQSIVHGLSTYSRRYLSISQKTFLKYCNRQRGVRYFLDIFTDTVLYCIWRVKRKHLYSTVFYEYCKILSLSCWVRFANRRNSSWDIICTYLNTVNSQSESHLR